LQPYEILIPEPMRASVSDDTPAAVTEFLMARGIAVAAVSICLDPIGVPEILLVTASPDPRPALAAFTPGTVSEQTARLREGIGLLTQYAEAVEQGIVPTDATTAQAVQIMFRVLEVLLGSDPRIRDLLDG
jgi:hypothetical protein